MNVHLYRIERIHAGGIYARRVASFDTSQTHYLVDTGMYEVRDDEGQPIGVQTESLITNEIGPVVFKFEGIAGGRLYFHDDIDVQHAVLRGAREL